MPKSFPKSIQTCFSVIFTKKSLSPVFHGGSSFRKFSKKVFSKFQKCPKLFPKVSKRVLSVFWGKFFEKNFAQCSMEARDFEKFQKKIRKVSKFQKCPKLLPKVSKRVLNMFWGKFFEKVHAQCSMEGRVFENFLTNQKILKIQKCPKSFPKVSKHVLNMFWGKLFEKFLPSFPRLVES